jgi:DNA mismatch endonuclease (patch repair protein)
VGRGRQKTRTRIVDGHRILIDDETSARMGRVRQRGTRPELIVRQLIHGLGHRYRVKNRDLPGSPDIANRSQGWAVFVHGCYWHRHPGCSKSTTPRRNRAFWKDKFRVNVERDRRALRQLRRMGYRTKVVWECQCSREQELGRRLDRWLSMTSKGAS